MCFMLQIDVRGAEMRCSEERGGSIQFEDCIQYLYTFDGTAVFHDFEQLFAVITFRLRHCSRIEKW